MKILYLILVQFVCLLINGCDFSFNLSDDKDYIYHFYRNNIVVKTEDNISCTDAWLVCEDDTLFSISKGEIYVQILSKTNQKKIQKYIYVFKDSDCENEWKGTIDLYEEGIDYEEFIVVFPNN